MNIVNPDTVALDSVELTFKDQYLGRSEMCRMKNSLVNTCVYLNKKIEMCGGNVRCQVFEMWAKGERVACGVINDDTKIVFRSSTSMVYLFLQMSSEMWDFDIHGDLYFEKAVNGFMTDLFQKWKKFGSNHEVTIVLFSRTFYCAQNLTDFPDHMKGCVQQDYKGRFYEDFYRVAVQNERYDDWFPVLVQLRKLFMEYQDAVLEYHSRPNIVIPKPVNSTAAQGNFLEVLNMSLNVFEKHFLDRSFDRTGQLSVVITPGVGVFEVDRELTNVTKQRIIDNGVGSDLVCVGEQPLHAVPLLKFHNKDKSMIADDYSMPHWINLSFYSSNKKLPYSNFVPRIKLPPRLPSRVGGGGAVVVPPSPHGAPSNKAHNEEDESTLNPPTAIDYDAYDAQVFTLPSVHNGSTSRFSKLSKKSSVSSALDCVTSRQQVIRRKLSDPDIHHSLSSTTATDSPGSSPVVLSATATAISIPRTKTPPELKGDVDLQLLSRTVPGSIGSMGANQLSPPQQHPAPPKPGRALINPFDPSHITIKLTSNRRRWTHIFPKGPTGVLIQQHHYQALPMSDGDSAHAPPTKTPSTSPPPPHHNNHCRMVRSVSQVVFQDHARMRARPSILTITGQTSSGHSLKKSPMTLLWGATGEQEWTPALTTDGRLLCDGTKVIIGVDWKSLTIPACLPITTDYFPDEVCLRTDYLVSDYNLLPDATNAEFAQQRAVYKKPLSTQEVLQELVNQRLAQGFQLIVESPAAMGVATPGAGYNCGSSVIGPRAQDLEPAREYKLSIGRVFHRIVLLNASEIQVTRYRPRHPYPPFNIQYRYRFQAPDHEKYEVSWVSFNTEKLENYNWNHLDHYICSRGSTDYELTKNLKYWRFKVYLLPLSQAPTKKILEGSEFCDLYAPLSLEEQTQMSESFLRFIETWVNKMKRPSISKKHKNDWALIDATCNKLNKLNSVVGNSPYRDRLGSNRLPDKPRPRSGSKVMERGRASPAMDMIIPISTLSVDNDHNDSGDQDSPLSPLDAVLVKESASLAEIVEAMQQPTTGIDLLSPHPNLPNNVFVSADCIRWLIAHMEGVTTHSQALAILENMRQERLLCHASGDMQFPFIGGFYLYFFTPMEKEKDFEPSGDVKKFENEWLEVEMKPPQPVPPVPTFLTKKLPSCGLVECRAPSYKQTHLEIDVQGKSDRIEWGHAKYQDIYHPYQAYEIEVQWVAASGSIVSELITGWARKAQSNSMQMIPVPADPFSLPYAIKSDPLRSPVFVPLNTECLMGSKCYLFEEFPEDTWAQRLVMFQEEVAYRFGFITCVMEKENEHHHHQYIHLSGNVFLMVPSMPCTKTRTRTASISTRSKTIRKYTPVEEEDVAASPHHQYITRHVGFEEYGHDARVGFLWSWNHMVSRRWKWSATAATSDEAFQNKLLSDFRLFCSNDSNRLKTFWDDCWIQAKLNG
ncbi:GATOR complex protein Iml1 isoform X3 [Nilaparvata lugens]|uniref:GATOR complex protein Iml1 isoform X3 n=1 Tax=Nilaparvata lugens TaxID=108931 RepID=UPI00193EA8AB|nr:GATOR complex protein Iml1 isoform X3 [Nilaparvata lugens]